MSLLNNNVYVSVEKGAEDYKFIKGYFDSISIETHSSTGLEIAVFVVGVLEVIIMGASSSLIYEKIKEKIIVVKLKGMEFNDSVTEIINAIKNDPIMYAEAKAKYESNTLGTKGKVKASLEFEKRLEELIRERG